MRDEGRLACEQSTTTGDGGTGVSVPLDGDIGSLKECRRIATRLEKLALNFAAMLKLAIIEQIHIMQNEHVFRFILIVGFAAVFPVGLYHRLKSQASKERLNRREEGLFILLTLRPIGAITMLGTLAYVINPDRMAWSAVPLPLWLRWFGVGLGVSAATLLIYVFRSLGTNLTDTVVTRVRHTLVTSGPYRWVRHPFYVAGALGGIANSLVIAN